MSLTHKDVETILALIERSGYDELRLEFDELKIEVRRSAGLETEPRRVERGRERDASPRLARGVGAPAPVVSSAAAVPSARKPSTAANNAVPVDCVAIRSPSVGVFYRASSPDKPPFVEVGSKVTPMDVVALVEVMKLFNSVHPEATGTIIEIRAENGALVEFDQVLMVLQPDVELLSE
jgi:acetyl-CoA carboxylase biotin carboxyl carrier protein